MKKISTFMLMALLQVPSAAMADSVEHAAQAAANDTETTTTADGSHDNPYTVAQLLAQREQLAASSNTVWVKASLLGLGDDGLGQSNADTEDADGKTVRHMAARFGDATDNFVAYSWQILGQLDMADLTNTSDLLIALTYGTDGHPFGNTANAQYASNEEPGEPHFSLAKVEGALTVTISNGLRGYHVPACYQVPEGIIAVKVSAGYSSKNGAYVNYTNFSGSDAQYVTPKNGAFVLMANDGTYPLTLSADLYEQTMSNSNALNPGTQAGLNAGTTKNRARLRFVNDGTKVGFERNSDENCTVMLEAKEEVFIQVSSLENNFWGNYAWENEQKNWIGWAGGSYTSDIIPPVAATQHLPAVIHNLQGQRLATMQKGINIVAGKKILVR